MKTLSLLVLAFAMHTATAASPFLPIGPTNTFSSGERKLVEQAIAQAEAENKLVFIDMAAAWCGPCARLEQSEAQNEELLKPIFSKFVRLTLEEMFLESDTGADFMPHEANLFPSLHVYNPTTQKWTLFLRSDAAGLKQALEEYVANEGLADVWVNKVYAAMSGGQKVTDSALWDATGTLAFEKSGEEYLAFVTKVVAAVIANPARFESSLEEVENTLAFGNIWTLQQGKLTIAQIGAADPNALPALKSMNHHILFGAPLGLLIRTQGNKAASDQCQTLAAQAAAGTTDQPAEMQARMKITRDLTCLQLQVQLKEKTGADVLAFEASLSADQRTSFNDQLMKTLAATGTTYEQALKYATAWQKEWTDRVASSPVIAKRVNAATAARVAAYKAGKSHP